VPASGFFFPFLPRSDFVGEFLFAAKFQRKLCRVMAIGKCVDGF
jgi:hypothetical protein